MGRIRDKDTGPEKRVRSALHGLGYRFRLHGRHLAGRPDIILPKYKTVIFVHGCFWHRHPGCRFAYMPKSRVDFWTEKFEKTVVRDQEVQTSLQRVGWRVIIVWECETSDEHQLKARLRAVIDDPGG
jgi:DNA mismatch endonuclease, patch repair protein